MPNAKAGDVLVRLSCRCEGAVLVIDYLADEWTCPTCAQAGTETGRTTLTEEIIDGGIPSAAIKVKRLRMDAPEDRCAS